MVPLACIESRRPQRMGVPSYIKEAPMSDYNWDVSYREIRYKDHILAILQDLFGESGRFSPSNTVILWSGGYPTWRHLMYYFPEYPVYWLIDESISGSASFHSEYYVATHHQEGSYTGLPFWVDGLRPEVITIPVDEAVETIVCIPDGSSKIYRLLMQGGQYEERMVLPNGQSIFIIPFSDQVINLGSFLVE